MKHPTIVFRVKISSIESSMNLSLEMSNDDFLVMRASRNDEGIEKRNIEKKELNLSITITLQC